ncbi:MAG: hypothetical protein JXR70_01755 [Spirochaetales bacterium]|nr:hypothetical protein [Spirochaetales bacterium]
MKNLMMGILFLVLFFSCGTQGEGTRPISSNLSVGKSILGGYSPISLQAELVKKAVNYLILQKQGEYPQVVSIKVIEAFSQVVSGTNIKLIIAYKIKDDFHEHQALAVVNFDLQANPREIRELIPDYKAQS